MALPSNNFMSESGAPFPLPDSRPLNRAKSYKKTGLHSYKGGDREGEREGRRGREGEREGRRAGKLEKA